MDTSATGIRGYSCNKLARSRLYVVEYKWLVGHTWVQQRAYVDTATGIQGYSYRCGYNCNRLARSRLYVVGYKWLVRHTWIQQQAHVDTATGIRGYSNSLARRTWIQLQV